MLIISFYLSCVLLWVTIMPQEFTMAPLSQCACVESSDEHRSFCLQLNFKITRHIELLHSFHFSWSLALRPVVDLEGGRAGTGPLLGDGLMSLTVLLICDNATVLWRHHRQFISSNTKNMVLRIFKMIATSGFLTALECTKFVWIPLGKLSALSQSS